MHVPVYLCVCLCVSVCMFVCLGVCALCLCRPTASSKSSSNFHDRQCNYSCGFCFHTAKTSFLLPIEVFMFFFLDDENENLPDILNIILCLWLLLTLWFSYQCAFVMLIQSKMCSHLQPCLFLWKVHFLFQGRCEREGLPDHVPNQLGTHYFYFEHPVFFYRKCTLAFKEEDVNQREAYQILSPNHVLNLSIFHFFYFNFSIFSTFFYFLCLQFSTEIALSLSRKMWKRGPARFYLQIMYSINWHPKLLPE